MKKTRDRLVDIDIIKILLIIKINLIKCSVYFINHLKHGSFGDPLGEGLFITSFRTFRRHLIATNTGGV